MTEILFALKNDFTINISHQHIDFVDCYFVSRDRFRSDDCHFSCILLILLL
ncbi:hypothetical protein Gromo_00553 [Candidatus Gromoviella agglomerans]|nr:hypothetical protein Gromo_00553 [Candidatus Gromoviella agglomerans]